MAEEEKKGRQTRYIRLTISAWYELKDECIHITAYNPARRFHVTVNNRPGSKRCHERLYDHLKRLLAEQGKWPEGAA